VAAVSAFVLALGGLTGAVVVISGGSASAAVPGAPAGWTTMFSDDFNGASGTGLNTANWLYDIGTSYNGGAGAWGTGEVETATASTQNVYQDGSGHLVIKPIKDAAGHWTSGRIETQRTDFAAPAGGQVQISASLQQPNPAHGLGYWPAFWAMGAAARPVGATNWPSIGELDIMEDVNALSQHSTTFHCGAWAGECHDPDGISSGLQTCSGCQTGYHTYSAVIDRTNTSAEQLRFYLDGTLTYTVNENQVSVATWQAAVDHGFFAIFDVAIAGSYPDKVCGCTSPSADISSGAGMSVDWFAVYQKAAGGTTTPPPTTPPATGGSITGYGGKCVDVNAANSANGTAVQLWDCNGTNAQKWTVGANTSLRALGKCLDVTGNATANNSKVEIWDCNGGGNQVWQQQSDGTLRNPQSGRCLDDPGSSTTNGTQLIIWDCSAAANQKWTLAG
jgi:hypothetical protein